MGATAVGRARLVEHDRVDKVFALVCSRLALFEIGSQRHRGLDFKALRLIDRALQAIPQAEGKGQIGADLPCVLHVGVVGLGLEVADRGLARRQQRAIMAEGEVGGVLREPSNDGGSRILHFRRGIQTLVGPPSGQTLRDQILLEGVRRRSPLRPDRTMGLVTALS